MGLKPDLSISCSGGQFGARLSHYAAGFYSYVDSSLPRNEYETFRTNNVIKKKEIKKVCQTIIDGHGDSLGVAQGVLTLQRTNDGLTYSPDLTLGWMSVGSFDAWSTVVRSPCLGLLTS